MNKKILYSLMIAAASFAVTGCDSFLKEHPKDQMPDSEAYKNPQLLYLNTVANLYTRVGADYGGGGLQGCDRGIYDLNTFSSDEAMLPTRGGDWYDGGLWQNLFLHNWGTNNDLTIGAWAYLYEVIGLCNQSLDKLKELQKEDPENPNYEIYIAEVRSFRAMYYYYLLDLFARVPILETATVQMSEVKQSERKDVFDFVWKELQESAGKLSDAKSANTGEYYGRMTKGVAYFVMCKLALNAEVYTDNDWTDGNRPDGKSTMLDVEGQQKNCWEAVEFYADKIADLGYTLQGGVEGFAQNFAANNETSTENIFTIPMDPTLYKSRFMNCVRTRHYNHGLAINNQGGWNGSSATKEALSVFGYGKADQDPRFVLTYFGDEQIVGADGKVVMDGDAELRYKPNDIALDLSGSASEKTAGARMKKYEFDPTATNDGQSCHNDIVLFRYSDVLLMKAEAMVRNGGDGQAPFDEVRNRVGAAAMKCNLQNILDERLRELAWEGHRRQDLIRFGEYTKAVNDRPVTGAFTTVFPIHQNTLALNPNLTQNYGY